MTPISSLVNSLKGVPSRRLRQRFEIPTHHDHLWSPTYLAASASAPPLSSIRQYIETRHRPT
ncbi:MAG TPA: transposase [Acidimicrobiia bacterium]|nr:transposase [Acidimicrobiia bacterium]